LEDFKHYSNKMKKLILIAAGLVMACNSSQKTTQSKIAIANPVDYAESITQAELKTHLFIYASDEFEGRETGQPGQKKAIAYLKNQYETLGIKAAKNDGDYFQKVPLEIKKTPVGSITIGDQAFAIGEDFISLRSMSGSVNEIVYVGYGIEEGDYSNYKDLDVEGKIVLIKAGEPKNEDGTYRISGDNTKSNWSKQSEEIGIKSRLASEKRVKGMFFFNPEAYPMYQNYYNRMKASNSGQISIKTNAAEEYKSFMNANMAKAILADIETNDTPQVIPISITGDLKMDSDDVDSENVVAILKGSEKPEEYVVISSHLDHIGVNADGEINNGADDDGSGTVALLEIAQAFKKAADAGHGPKRSIIFLHVTGEEKGLLGSQYYTDNDPIVPLKNTVANLNIDMIGRIDPKREGERNYIYLIGSDKLSTDLHKLSEEVNTKFTNIELDYTYNDENDPNRFYYRSDHYNFAKNNIPIIFYFNGTHDDYHRPGDTPDKINYDLLENRTRLIFHTAWEIANRDQRVIVDKSSK